MKGYVLAEVEVTDPTLFEQYRPLASASITAFGGRYLIRGGAAELAEGDRLLHRFVVLEFASPERAREWYHSPQYQAAKAIRERAARTDLFLIDGHDPT
ncbi:MAG: DUF1330 domain-containing protein [Acetobacteraceae bacterium]